MKLGLRVGRINPVESLPFSMPLEVFSVLFSPFFDNAKDE